jgi:hypothetical protein
MAIKKLNERIAQTQGYNPQGSYPPQTGGYPASDQQSYVHNPYSQSTSASGMGYIPSQSGGYPGQQQPHSTQGGYQRGQQGAGYGMGPNSGGFMSNNQRSQRLNQVIHQYEINQQFTARLQELENCEVVVLCDDSGSMNTPIQGSNETRWDELKPVRIKNLIFEIHVLIFMPRSLTLSLRYAQLWILMVLMFIS